MLKTPPAEGGDSSAIAHTDEMSLESLQLIDGCILKGRLDPGFREMEEVSFEEGWVNPEIVHVWCQSGNVEGGHSQLSPDLQVPSSRVLVQGSVQLK